MSQIITGLVNSSHQAKFLSDMANITNLQQLTERLLTLESTTQATNHFKPETTQGITAPIRSDQSKKVNKPL